MTTVAGVLRRLLRGEGHAGFLDFHLAHASMGTHDLAQCVHCSSLCRAAAYGRLSSSDDAATRYRQEIP